MTFSKQSSSASRNSSSSSSKTEDSGPGPSSRGVSYAAWTPAGYATAESRASLAQLAATGARDVPVVTTGYMRSLTDGCVRSLPERTPTLEAVKQALTDAREVGLRTALKPHVDVLGGAYRGAVAPNDWARWFASYRDFLLPWAELALQQGCASFWVGTELDSTTIRHEEWATLLNDVRQVFPGPLVYAANWTDLELDQTAAMARLVDVMGVDGYFPLAEGPAPSVADLVEGWRPWLDILSTLADGWQRPLWLTEVGCMSRQGAAASPWEYGGTAPVDVALQARYYEATLRAVGSTPAVVGLFFWAWGLGPGGPADGSHSPRGKPAEEVLQQWWAGTA